MPWLGSESSYAVGKVIRGLSDTVVQRWAPEVLGWDECRHSSFAPDATAPVYTPTVVSVGVDELRQAGQDTLQAKRVGVAGAIRAALGSARR